MVPDNNLENRSRLPELSFDSTPDESGQFRQLKTWLSAHRPALDNPADTSSGVSARSWTSRGDTPCADAAIGAGKAELI